MLGLFVVIAGCGKGDGRDYSVADCIQALKDPDPNVRYTAASTLQKYGPKAQEAVPALTEALGDSDTNVRMRAAYALGAIGAPAAGAVPALTKAQRDREKLVREAATSALKQVQPKKR
jgi:HEAT repeat protein